MANPLQATKPALRALAHRHQALTTEITEPDTHLKALVTQARPGLLAIHGVGIETAAQLLITAGDNPDRHGDHVERAVGLPVSAATEPVAGGFAAGGRDRG